MTALYTVNLRIMGKSNTPLLGVQVIFDKIGAFFSLSMVAWNLIIGLAVLALLVKYLLDWLLHTEFGLCLQATGDNEQHDPRDGDQHQHHPHRRGWASRTRW